jgi:hypothetical protein
MDEELINNYTQHKPGTSLLQAIAARRSDYCEVKPSEFLQAVAPNLPAFAQKSICIW